MEINFISKYQTTSFYVNLVNHTYGVYINIKDIDKKDEIIQQILEENKERIESWKKDWKEGVA
ncbi:MAG: hypothetical protein J6K45_04750 [Clostridia bacterium]|nr:hypothetical protein [Clostridia bacterium]